MDSRAFVKHLIDTIKAEQKKSETLQINDSSAPDQSELPSYVIIHWLNFAVYYERAATYFIGKWINGVKKTDVLINYAYQIRDEANHYVWLGKHLSEDYGVNHEDFDPPHEWKYLMEEYYPGITSLTEQLAAHNIASEMGVLGFLEFNLDRFPKNLNDTVKKVYKDELYHVTFAKRLLIKYCTTQSLQDKAMEASLKALELMRQAREVFVSI